MSDDPHAVIKIERGGERAELVRVTFHFGGAAFLTDLAPVQARDLARNMVRCSDDIEGPAVEFRPVEQ